MKIINEKRSQIKKNLEEMSISNSMIRKGFGKYPGSHRGQTLSTNDVYMTRCSPILKMMTKSDPERRAKP